jgi:hypothetical protein
MGIFKFGSNFTPFIGKYVAALDGKKPTAPGQSDAEIAQLAAEKKARVDAEGEEIARKRAIEADEAAEKAQIAQQLKDAKRAEQLAAYRAGRPQPPVTTPGGPDAVPGKTLYSPQAALAAGVPSTFGALGPANGPVRGLSGQSLNALLESLAAAPAAKK